MSNTEETVGKQSFSPLTQTYQRTPLYSLKTDDNYEEMEHKRNTPVIAFCKDRTDGIGIKTHGEVYVVKNQKVRIQKIMPRGWTWLTGEPPVPLGIVEGKEGYLLKITDHLFGADYLFIDKMDGKVKEAECWEGVIKFKKLNTC